MMAKTQFPFLIAKWICSDCIWKGRFNNDHHQLYSSNRERVVKLGTSTKVMLKVLQCCNPFLLHTVLNRILLTHFIFLLQAASQLNSMPSNDISILEGLNHHPNPIS